MARSTKTSSRPQIWAEGRQNPPFQPRAFALASVIYARGSLSGLLGRCADSAEVFSATVATGRWRVPAHRLGKTGRYLPTVATTAALLGGGAGLLRRAGGAVAIAEPQAPVSIFDAPPAPMPTPKRPVRIEPDKPDPPKQILPRTTPEDDPDLAAIRALIEAAPPDPAPPKAEPPAPVIPAFAADAPAADAPKEPDWRREWLANGAAKGLGYGLLAMALPVGAARALMAHLNGEDLRVVSGSSN